MADISIKIFRQEANFVAGVAKTNQFPKLFLSQFAFVGKSNVGKSSLINSICNRKTLARVSHTPGRTQQINFFSIGNKFLLADLPGYGFAKVSTNQRKNWQELLVYYLENGNQLILVNLLIDARRGFKENDIAAMDLLQSHGKNFQIIFTKTDKIHAVDKFLSEMREFLRVSGFVCNIIITSSRNGLGIKDLQISMLRCL